MSYKDKLIGWAKETFSDCRTYIPDSLSLSSFASELKNLSDDAAYGMCVGLRSAVMNNSKTQDHGSNKHRHVTIHTQRYGDGSVRLFNPYTGETYAYYGVDRRGMPFFSGYLDGDLLGRAGITGGGGILNQLADGDALNYDSGRHYRYGSKRAYLEAYQKAA